MNPLASMTASAAGRCSCAAVGRMLGYLQSVQFRGHVVGPLVGGMIGVHLGLQLKFSSPLRCWSRVCRTRAVGERTVAAAGDEGN
jgi:hypothetical protein